MDDITKHPRYDEARRHARDLRSFHTHLLVYLAVNAGLIILNLLGTPTRLWWGWVTLGWGVGLLAHAVSVFALGGWLGPKWEERKIREYLDRR